MILIADSGSTSCDWALLSADNSIPWRHRCDGINPVFQSAQEIENILRQELSSLFHEYPISRIAFYGAGCLPSKVATMQAVFQTLFPSCQTIGVHSDIWAAIHALCGREEGIACILGTGSNSCLFDGRSIVQQTSPLGFILGDEGSAAYLGKNFLGLLLKDQLPLGMRQDFLDTYGLSVDDIIEHVYRRPFPNRFLASFSPFILAQSHLDLIRDFLIESFSQFLVRNVKNYHRPDLPIHFVGSVAHYYRPFVQAALRRHSLIEGEIVQSPLEGLIRYYS